MGGAVSESKHFCHHVYVLGTGCWHFNAVLTVCFYSGWHCILRKAPLGNTTQIKRGGMKTQPQRKGSHCERGEKGACKSASPFEASQKPPLSSHTGSPARGNLLPFSCSHRTGKTGKKCSHHLTDLHLSRFKECIKLTSLQEFLL